MLPSSQKLLQALAAGVHRIGEIEILPIALNDRFKLCHFQDAGLLGDAGGGGLRVYDGPAAARDIGSYGEDGSYRYLKAQENLRRGWEMRLSGVDELRLALDEFYPACVGMWLAQCEGRLEVQHLRDKLQRQTGIYRRCQALSDDGLQQLVPATCSASVPCARRILWQIDAHTPLDASPASQCRGIARGVADAEAIPLLCREACNAFVAGCLR